MGLVNLMKNRNRVASCKSEVWKDEQPPRSAARSLDHRSCGESSRRQPSAQGSHRQHYLIPREWLTSAVSPLHAKQIRSTKWLKSRSSMQESLKGKGTDTNCRERHSVVHSCISSIHAATCRSDEHPSAVTFSFSPERVQYVHASGLYHPHPCYVLLSGKTGSKKLIWVWSG